MRLLHVVAKIMNTIDRQCEKFMGGPTVAYRERVHVTLGRGGKIFLNAKAHGMMGRPGAVFLYFNRQKDMIVLEPSQVGSSSIAFTLMDGQHGGRVIWANPFCKHFGIKVEGTQRFVDPETDAAGRMYLKLYETVNVARGPKERRGDKEKGRRGD